MPVFSKILSVVCHGLWPPVSNRGPLLERYLAERACRVLGVPREAAFRITDVETGRNAAVRRWEVPELGPVYARGWRYDFFARPAHEHQVAGELLRDAGLAVPRLLLVDHSFATLRRYGLEVVIEQAAPGAPLPDDCSVLEDARETLRRVAGELARLHGRRGRAWGQPWRPLNEMNNPQAYWAGRLAKLRARIPGRTRLLEPGQVTDLVAALERQLPETSWPFPALVHGDFSNNNLFLDSDSAITWIDFNTVHYGHPAEDLAAAALWFERGDLFGVFLDDYFSAAGINPRELAPGLRFFTLLRLLERLSSRIVKQRHAGEHRQERINLEQENIERRLIEKMGR